MTSHETRPPDAEGIRPADHTDGPDRRPTGVLGGQPVNSDETAPREQVPNPGDGPDRHPDAVDDEPGGDLSPACGDHPPAGAWPSPDAGRRWSGFSPGSRDP